MSTDAKNVGVLRLGDVTPDFEAESTEGKIQFHKFIEGKWCIFFSHPRDFTPVCTTELGRVAQLKQDFAKRNCVVIALSVDGREDHAEWIKDINEVNKCKVDYPIIADKERKVSLLYGMLDQTNVNAAGLPLTVRSVFIIGTDKKIKLMLIYPASTGRNFNEILRVLDSLQLTAQHQVATPADWKKGEKCIVIPAVNDDDAKKKFGTFDAVKKYLRYVDDPTVAK